MSRLPLKRAKPAVLLQFAEHLSDRYSDVITKGYNRQTGIVAVVEKIGGGKRSRKLVMFNSGFRTDKPPPPARAGKLVQPGPYLEVRNGRKIHFLMTSEGVRVEYDPKRGVITALEHPDGTREVIKKGARLKSFGNITVGTNSHHAEGRFLNWVTENKYKIVVASPTRGCCLACGSQLRQVLGRDFEKAVPKSRWTARAFNLHNKERKLLEQKIAAGKPAAAKQYVARGLSAEQLARLRAQAGSTLRAFKAPDPKLARIARVLKVAGPVMVAFDAMTSYAKASEQWQAGAKADATETMVALGGRLAGAFVGAETMGMMFGGFGSVVPGLGTTVGALTGAVVGGVLGACVGEQKAREFCHQVFAWAAAQGHDADRTAAAPLLESTIVAPASPAAREFTQAPVAELQQQMYQSGYGDAEVNFVCETVSARIIGHADATPQPVTAVFSELASELPSDLASASPGDAGSPIDDYPWPEFARDGYEATSDELFDPPMDILQEDVSGHLQDHDRPSEEEDGAPAHEVAHESDAAEIVDGVPVTGDHDRDVAEQPDAEMPAVGGEHDRSNERSGDTDGSDDGRVELDTSVRMLDPDASPAGHRDPDTPGAEALEPPDDRDRGGGREQPVPGLSPDPARTDPSPAVGDDRARSGEPPGGTVGSDDGRVELTTDVRMLDPNAPPRDHYDNREPVPGGGDPSAEHPVSRDGDAGDGGGPVQDRSPGHGSEDDRGSSSPEPRGSDVGASIEAGSRDDQARSASGATAGAATGGDIAGDGSLPPPSAPSDGEGPLDATLVSDSRDHPHREPPEFQGKDSTGAGDRPAADPARADAQAGTSDLAGAGRGSGVADASAAASSPSALDGVDGQPTSAPGDNSASDASPDADKSGLVLEGKVTMSDDERRDDEQDEPGEDDPEDPDLLLSDDEEFVDDDDGDEDAGEQDDADETDEPDDDPDDDDEAGADDPDVDDLAFGDDEDDDAGIDDDEGDEVDDPEDPDDEGFDILSDDDSGVGVDIDGDDDHRDDDDSNDDDSDENSGHFGDDDGSDRSDTHDRDNDGHGWNDGDDQDNSYDSNSSDDDHSGGSGSGSGDQDDDE